MRVRMTMKEYNELITARDWCALKGFTGFQQFYTELLAEKAKTRRLPRGVQQETDEDEPDRRGRRF